MTVRHHPSEATLMAYSSGALSQALATVTATHLALCPDCRRQVELFDSMGGELLDGGDTVAVSDDLLERTLRAARQVDPASVAPVERPAAPDLASASIRIPNPLRDLIGSSADSLPWKRLSRGISSVKIDLGSPAGGRLRLLKIAPGTVVPHHGHRGQEMTMVLQGSFSDETGRYCAGDVADLDEDIVHQPVADTDADCICVIASDARLKFSGFVPRLVQPFVDL